MTLRITESGKLPSLSLCIFSCKLSFMPCSQDMVKAAVVHACAISRFINLVCVRSHSRHCPRLVHPTKMCRPKLQHEIEEFQFTLLRFLGLTSILSSPTNIDSSPELFNWHSAPMITRKPSTYIHTRMTFFPFRALSMDVSHFPSNAKRNIAGQSMGNVTCVLTLNQVNFYLNLLGIYSCRAQLPSFHLKKQTCPPDVSSFFGMVPP